MSQANQSHPPLLQQTWLIVVVGVVVHVDAAGLEYIFLIVALEYTIIKKCVYVKITVPGWGSFHAPVAAYI